MSVLNHQYGIVAKRAKSKAVLNRYIGVHKFFDLLLLILAAVDAGRADQAHIGDKDGSLFDFVEDCARSGLPGTPLRS